MRTEDVGPREEAGIDDGQAVVRFGCEVDDDVDVVLTQGLLGELEICDVALHERRPVLRPREVLAVARVGQEVVGDDVVVGIFLEPEVDEVRADEAGRAGD